MTAAQAISLVDDLKPNAVPQETKLRWLGVLDGLVWRNVAATHRGAQPFEPCGPDSEPGKELLIPAPYDTLYRRWLEAQIDLTNGEFERYNASITVFQDEYRVFENDYNRTHTPKSCGRFRF